MGNCDSRSQEIGLAMSKCILDGFRGTREWIAFWFRPASMREMVIHSKDDKEL